MLDEVGLATEGVAEIPPTTDHARLEPFDAIVLDLDDAGRDSLGFVRALRSDGKRVLPPVLVLSYQPSSRDIIEAFASGVEDFLARPFREPELGARVVGLVRRARIARAARGPT